MCFPVIFLSLFYKDYWKDVHKNCTQPVGSEEPEIHWYLYVSDIGMKLNVGKLNVKINAILDNRFIHKNDTRTAP